MNVIVVDDERIVLSVETATIQSILPEAEVSAFRTGSEALEYAAEHQIDIAFLDISMGSMDGISLARQLKSQYSKINIIFCTGYSEYAMDAISLYCSAYLLKPITEEHVREALEQLRFPPFQQKSKRIKVRCFGNFEVFCDGIPIKFKYRRTKELLAYLIDRNGAMLSTGEMLATLFEDEDKGSYMRNLKSDLVATFQALGAEEILIQQKGTIGIAPDLLDCDYYDYLRGATELFHGEYMTQYSFSEDTLAKLLHLT